jgi:hypothetical protein
VVSTEPALAIHRHPGYHQVVFVLDFFTDLYINFDMYCSAPVNGLEVWTQMVSFQFFPVGSVHAWRYRASCIVHLEIMG